MALIHNSISETAWSPGIFTQNSLNGVKKTSSEQQLCWRKRFERGQRRIAKLVGAYRKSTVTQITSLYNCAEQESISECTTCRNLVADLLQQQKTVLVSSAVKNRNLWLQWAQAFSWRPGLMNLNFLLRWSKLLQVVWWCGQCCLGTLWAPKYHQNVIADYAHPPFLKVNCLKMPIMIMEH